MTQEERDDSPRHNCFGCGMKNPEGLHIDFEFEGTTVKGRFTPRATHQGWPGLTHGGIAAAAMDEAMGWAMYAAGAWAMTARMEVKYRQPLTLGEEVTITAQVTRDRGRRMEAEAEIRDAEGKVRAQATGIFIRMPDEMGDEVDTSYFGAK